MSYTVAEERMQNYIEELEQENRLLRARNDRLEAEAKAVSVQERCEYCDGTGDVHDRAGEWRGVCNCEAGKRLAAPVQDEAWKAEQKALADAAIKCATEAIADVNGPIKAVREYYGATPPAAPVLQDIEQYRMQMAGISTAAFGYWKEGDNIHPDYDTLALRDVAKLYANYAALCTTPAAPVQPVDIATLVEGMEVSIDVSTGEHDSGNRLFGSVTLVQENQGSKHGLILLVQEPEANFKTVIAPAQQCKWPTCQSEKYQQSLVEQIKQELVTGITQQWVDMPELELLGAYEEEQQGRFGDHIRGLINVQNKLKEKNT